MAEDYERISLVKPEVFIYQIPPRASNRAVRAADWNLESPDWKGRLRVVSMGEKCLVKLEDKISGELFAVCPVDNFPGIAVEPVSDSSRYFLLRLQDPSGQNAFVGLGFEDRGDAFDFNVSLQDHFKMVKKEQDLAVESSQPVEHKDYSLKAGQKIQINLGKKVLQKDEEEKSGPKQSLIGLSASGGLLPPPAGATPAPRTLQSAPAPAHNSQSTQSKSDDWGDFSVFE
ncbi:NECAP-like protein CG9132 [Geodia barretti]|uniref:NECAP-like protein CG9132 n=1 Tax=Geodia barretti TaxID=519541 RepID=A0AA35XG06_GEOBA|nr:NECAP-like protein CG9132 [Geodia barretti]